MELRRAGGGGLGVGRSRRSLVLLALQTDLVHRQGPKPDTETGPQKGQKRDRLICYMLIYLILYINRLILTYYLYLYILTI